MTTKTELEEMIGAWTNLQRQFWDNFMQGKKTSARSEWEEACRRPLEITQQVMTEMLQTQEKFTHNMLKTANPELEESEIIDQYFGSIKEMLDAGIKSQEELLETWFSLAREFERQAPSQNMMQWNPLAQSMMNPVAEWSKAVNNVFKAWENAAEKTLDAQNEFVSHLVPVEKPEATTKKAAPRSRKTASAEAKQSAA